MGKKNNSNKKKTQREINVEYIIAGVGIIKAHPLFSRCYFSTRVVDKQALDTSAISTCHSDGYILLNDTITLQPKQWAYVIAHNILHLAFGHFDADKVPENLLLWNMACDIYVDKFLDDIRFGQSIHPSITATNLTSYTDEATIYRQLQDRGFTGGNNEYGTAAIGNMDMKGLDKPLTYPKGKSNPYTKQFSFALAYSVSSAISVAGGHKIVNTANTPGQIAARWFIDHYPLLGGLAAHFKIIEDFNYCNRNEIHIAAVNVTTDEICINPAANLSPEEYKFVLAHEYLHAGLMHYDRCNGRDRYLWNVACDFVINGWLHELQIGVMPSEGLLYDPELAGLSAESIYDLLITDMRKYSKLGTFRGFHKGDIIGDTVRNSKNGVSLDEFCKSALQQGLEYHVNSGRGLLPAGLIEEIRALSMPPIPWDVALAKWFDIYFAPLEKHRTYARPSRRQASTPDIPKPSYVAYDVPVDSRTFGVIIDTSGSMDTKTLGKALGSIASYAVAHDVPFARVVFCDAAAYDEGYISPEDIAGRVRIKGRGGTRLQPGADVLESAKDFPKDGPILIITDGYIEDHLDIRHEHAYLLPKGHRLPYKAGGEVFYFEE